MGKRKRKVGQGLPKRPLLL